jgi:outer membrane protein TolC
MLESTRTAFDTESRYINARRERLDARIDLYLALGGGFNSENSYIFNDEENPEIEANDK